VIPVSLRTLLALPLLTLALVGCHDKKKEGESDDASAFPAAMEVNSDDPAMAEAMREARKTLPVFLAAMQDHPGTMHDFSVKAMFEQGGHVEHMWVNPVMFDGKAFHGRLNDDPTEITSPKRNDRVVAKPTGVSDWMYIDGNKLRGGYTLRVMRSRLNEGQQKELEKSLGYEF
jgi:uncharacterized protein YegJ (DUF2314 family)